MRFVSAQLEAYVSNDVWRRNAQHANAMALRLSQGLAAIPGIDLQFPTQSNEVFANIPRKVIDRLAAKGIEVTEGELDETAPPRFVTAWDSKVEDVDNLIAAIKLCSGDG
jgi:threonine aldolase